MAKAGVTRFVHGNGTSPSPSRHWVSTADTTDARSYREARGPAASGMLLVCARVQPRPVRAGGDSGAWTEYVGGPVVAAHSFDDDYVAV